MAFTYVHPPVDNVAFEYYVDVPDSTDIEIEKIETVEKAIEVYIRAFCEKFQSRWGRDRRRLSLQHFQQYLVTQGHSMRLMDLTRNNGQSFIDNLVNQYNGSPLGAGGIKRYRSALCSFSRFLQQMGLLEENIFLGIKGTN